MSFELMNNKFLHLKVFEVHSGKNILNIEIQFIFLKLNFK